MSKDMKKSMVPRLRFPEFREAGEWVEKKLDTVCHSFSGGTPDTTKKEYYSGNIPFIRSAEINKKETGLFLSDDGFKNSSAKLINKGDVLVALYGANSGDVALAKIDGAINQAILCLKSEYSNPFIYQFLTFKKDWIISKYIQGGQGNLSGDIIKSISLLFPKDVEQQKIATTLTTLDDLITAQSEKIKALQAHKKGLMQEVFPAEGERVPRRRFREFVGTQKWEEFSIDYLVKENILYAPKDGNHGNIHPKSSDYVKKGIPFIMAKDVKNGMIDFANCTFIRKEQADNLQKGFAKEGDVLITHKGTVGEVTLIEKIDFPYLMLTPQVTYYRIRNKSKLSNKFLSVLFTSERFQRELKIASGGATRAYIGITEQGKLKITMPSNILEQQKIADCLSSLNNLITAQSEKLENLKTHKKGLMQQLFPPTNSNQ